MPRPASYARNPYYAIISQPSHTYITPTAMLADILEPLISELHIIADKANSNEDYNSAINEVGKRVTGGVNLLAERAATHYAAASALSIVRRIYGIQNRETKATNADLADALLLACGKYMNEYDLLTLPAGMKAAMEMVTIYDELHDLMLEELEIRRLAKGLMEYAVRRIEVPDNLSPPDPELVPILFG